MSQFVDKKLSLSEWLPLIGITISAFVFNTSEFMPVGLLTDIGATFSTTEGETGSSSRCTPGPLWCCRCRL